jgi:ankyrin repeat protein
MELVAYFIELGADVNAKNVFEDTPLKIAQDKGFVSVIDLLKTKNAVDK